jgi:enamine deaminase RidA (YjgF/YER057c/UK114 family)
MASRVGNMLFTSGIFGRDPVTDEMPESVEQQCINCLVNLRRVLDEAGAKATDVAQVAIYLKDNSARSHFNAPWVEMFPDEHSRPARHAHIVPGLNGAIQIQAIAVIEGKD